MKNIKLSEGYCQSSTCKTICNDCVFYSLVNGSSECISPDKTGVNCSTVIFCNLFQPMTEVDSPCVSFGEDEE
ncbi:MAG: hypothetical protein QNJ47_22940 [Nostocaceae cyanobacterium]|nr:hypothetical protein [Nostocaceae cyanobacterium]